MSMFNKPMGRASRLQYDAETARMNGQDQIGLDRVKNIGAMQIAREKMQNNLDVAKLGFKDPTPDSVVAPPVVAPGITPGLGAMGTLGGNPMPLGGNPLDEGIGYAGGGLVGVYNALKNRGAAIDAAVDQASGYRAPPEPPPAPEQHAATDEPKDPNAFDRKAFMRSIYGEGSGYADGGMVERPLTPDAENETEDASEGYMLPPDVVQLLGEDFLDRITTFVQVTKQQLQQMQSAPMGDE